MVFGHPLELWYEVGGKWQFDRTDAQINMDVHTGCAGGPAGLPNRSARPPRRAPPHPLRVLRVARVAQPW